MQRGGQLNSYTYDANNNLLTAIDASGLTHDEPTPLDIRASWDSLDRVTRVRSREEDSANFRFTAHAYDLNGNVTRRGDDGEETPDGGIVFEGRRNDYTYDAADWLASQLDHGTTPGSTDDRLITNTFSDIGLETSRVIARNDGAGNWITVQSTEWTHFLDGQLKTLTTRNGAGVTREFHQVGYLDAASDYVNGHRVTDQFWLVRPGNPECTAAPGCTATYTYDPQDRLRQEVNGQGSTTTFTLDAAGNVTRELVTGDGARECRPVWCEVARVALYRGRQPSHDHCNDGC